MKVTFITHSCFVVETEEIIIVFDYYKGTLPSFDNNKPIFFFSSHIHYDHFSVKIFDFAKQYKDVTYILSEDIRSHKTLDSYLEEKEFNRGQLYFMNAHEEKSFPSISLTIKTLDSTDEGVAFILFAKDKTIYHSGDLHWWSWQGETEEEYKNMTDKYQAEVSNLKGIPIDVAFLPLDPRQEDRYWWGIDYFMREIDASIVFPIHMWEDYSIIHKLKALDITQKYRDKILTITEENQIFQLS